MIITIKRQEPNVSAIKAIPLGRGLHICTEDGLQCTTASGISSYFLTLISMAMSIYILDPELLPDLPPYNEPPDRVVLTILAVRYSDTFHNSEILAPVWSFEATI